MKLKFLPLCAFALLVACNPSEIQVPDLASSLPLEDMAKVFSELPLEQAHLQEVFDAVNSSSNNGFDEEYTMSNLLSRPGTGVGDPLFKSSANKYEKPLKDLLADYFSYGYTKSRHSTFNRSNVGGSRTKSLDAVSYLESLEKSDIQIYWPYSENWDGKTFPIISFDPGNGAEKNYGYLVDFNEAGLKVVDSVIVDEKMAMERPVWVINRNDDSEFVPAKNTLFHRAYLPAADNDENAVKSDSTQENKPKALYLKSITAMQNYDSWFGGASEFFIKCGAIDGIRAVSEEELKLYKPGVTDLMVVVKRSQIGLNVPVNALLLSDFTDQMEKMAFLVVEDDGGKTTSWKCSAVVKCKSKSFGFELEIPYKDNDDIVWRGQLSHSFFGDEPIVTAGLGGVEVKFEQK